MSWKRLWWALALAGCNGTTHLPVALDGGVGAVRVRLRTAQDSAVAGARVTLGGQSALTDGSGEASFLSMDEGGWLVTVDPPGDRWSGELRPINVPALEVVDLEVTLTAREPSDVSVLFTGDLSFDQGLQDPNRDGLTGDSLVPDGPGAADGVAAILWPLSPLFRRSALVTGNLATSLGDGRTPHPMKASRALAPPEVALGLARAGITALNLGNDHGYDYLDDGVRQTLAAVDGAGLTRFGLGRDLPEARGSGLSSSMGITVSQTALSALVGHGTSPSTDQKPYFTAAPDRAGVVEATLANVKDAVTDAQLAGDVVVAHLTVGPEWGDSSAELGPLAAMAIDAGAQLVIGHGPRPLGGLQLANGVFIADNPGQLVFGSSRPEGRRAVVVEATVRHRRVEALRLWPLGLEQGQPRLATGQQAARIIREVASLSRGVIVYPHEGLGRVALDPSALQETLQSGSRVLPLGSRGSIQATAPVRVVEGDRLLASASTAGRLRPAGLQLGHELLWEGDFEDELVREGAPPGRLAGWYVTAPDEGPTRLASHGALGLALRRKALNINPSTVRAVGLISLLAGHRYTFRGCWTGSGEVVAKASLDLFAGRKAGQTPLSALVEVVASPVGDGFQCFEKEVEPTSDVLIAPTVRLLRPTIGTANLVVDELSLIEWDALEPSGALSFPGATRHEYARAVGSGEDEVTLSWVTRQWAPR